MANRRTAVSLVGAADPSRHALVRADCRDWLVCAARRADRYDLVPLDPPSFSKSKSYAGVLNVQCDHVALIRAAVAVLAPRGTLYFSNNLQQFAWAPRLRRVFDIDISTCPLCGGTLRIIGDVTDPVVIGRILEHRRSRAESRAPPAAASHPASDLLNTAG